MEDFIALEEHFGAHNYHPLPVVLVRGKGAWVWDHRGKMKLMEKGVLAKETHHVVVRFAPPLVVTKEEIDWSVECLSQIFAEIG